ncbi:MAG: hypothetical protein ACRDNP_08525, partial [Gaiellaceae bacterium]
MTDVSTSRPGCRAGRPRRGGLECGRPAGGADLPRTAFEAPGAVAVDLAAGSVTGASGNDSLVNINAVVGSRRADTLKGGTDEDLLVGLGGDDVLAGRGASDILSGSGGDDRVTGGGGLDIADYSSARRPIRVNLTTGRAFGEGRDRLREIEGIIGGMRGDKLIGDRLRNLILGGEGNDTIEGRAGRDDLDGGRARDHLN